MAKAAKTSLIKWTPEMTLITATSIAIKASTIPTYKNIWFTAETFINVKAIIKAEYTCRLGKDCPFLSFGITGAIPNFSYGRGLFIR